MKNCLLFVVLCLAGCTSEYSSAIFRSQVKAADKACKNSGGAFQYFSDISHKYFAVQCLNGDTINGPVVKAAEQ
jgi:hypothetical protein